MNKSQEVKIQSGAAGEVGRWCVVETNLHQERTAKFHLDRKAFEAYLPMRASRSKRKDADKATPLFPNYLFVRTDGGCSWTEVFSAIGVRSVLNVGGKPIIAPTGLVEAIKQREVFGLVQLQDRPVEMPHRPGDRVKVLSGPFEAYDAIFHEAIDARRVLILLSLFGRKTRVEVFAAQLKAAS